MQRTTNTKHGKPFGARVALMSFLLLLSGVWAMAQTRNVSGTVVDETGQPLPGVAIRVEGTTAGTVTDFDGKWNLNVSAGSNLIFSFIGYDNKTVAVDAAQSKYDVQMESSFSELDEVIEIPQTLECLEPLVASIPLQLLAYHIAVCKGKNVAQPRNLAKSVTVE